MVPDLEEYIMTIEEKQRTAFTQLAASMEPIGIDQTVGLEGSVYTAQVKCADNLDGEDLLNVDVAKTVLTQAIEDGDAELAGHAAAVLDCTLRENFGSVVVHFLGGKGISEPRDTKVWVSQGTGQFVTVDDAVQICNGINNVRFASSKRPNSCEDSVSVVKAQLGL